MFSTILLILIKETESGRNYHIKIARVSVSADKKIGLYHPQDISINQTQAAAFFIIFWNLCFSDNIWQLLPNLPI